MTKNQPLDHLLKSSFEYSGNENDPPYAYQRKWSLFANMAARLASTLAPAILWGQPTPLLETIITQNPDVLLYPVKSMGPNGEEAGTLYELLLGTDDDYIKNEKGETFLEMIRRLVIQHHGEKIEAQQRENRFRGWDEQKTVTKMRAAFDKLKEAFDNSTASTDVELANDTTLQTAITKFQTYLQPKGIITSGKNCIPQLWDYAAMFYDSNKYQAYGDFNSPKNNLFCEKILGTIDRRSAAWGMQVLRSGIYNFVAKNSQGQRHDVTSLFSVAPPQVLRLGDNALMDAWGRRVDSRWPGAAIFRQSMSRCFFQTYVRRQKHPIDRSLDQPKQGCCLVS